MVQAAGTVTYKYHQYKKKEKENGSRAYQPAENEFEGESACHAGALRSIVTAIPEIV